MSEHRQRPAGFDGAIGWVVASAMARLNRDMELAAVVELDPELEDRVLCVGSGPGVGVAALEARLARGLVCGIDPSAVMVKAATRRNRRGIDAGRVVVQQAEVEEIPSADNSFDGVVAVNSIQLWHLERGLAEVGRVLRPGGAFVAVTHVWALEKHHSVDEFSNVLASAAPGLELQRSTIRRFRSGKGLVLRGLNTDSAFACALEGSALTRRGRTWRSLKPRLMGVERSPGRLRLVYSPEVATTVQNLVEAERACCSWATWACDVNATAAVVDVSGRQAAIDGLASVLEAVAEPPNSARMSRFDDDLSVQRWS